jgi:lipoprotein-anchoring transpeptidase ErfK/SrfK
MQVGLIASRRWRQLAIVAAGCALVVGSGAVSAQADPIWPGGPDLPGVSTPSVPLPGSVGTEPSEQSEQRPPGRANFSTPVLEPAEGETVGIAQPVIISFTAAIDDKATAEKAIRVSTEPEVDGEYRWVGNKELRWKPNGFWPAGTQVDVQAGSAASSFTIGEEWVATADDNTHQLTVTVDGTDVRTMPISMGANENPTPNGTYTVGERYADMYMDSSTYGVPVDSPGGYRTYVEYAARLSNSGIFVHAAPWSVGQQGNTNVSHGCINVSTDDGRWFFENAPKGAPVIVQNTVGGTIDPADGLTDFTVA